MSLKHKVIRFILLILFASYVVTMGAVAAFLASTMIAKARGGYSEAVSATRDALWMSVGADKAAAKLTEIVKHNAYRYIGENLVNPLVYTVATLRNKTITVTTPSPFIKNTVHDLSVSPASVNFVTIIRF